MRRLEVDYAPTKPQREFHDDLVSKFLHMSAGYGCMAEESLIETSLGQIAMGDIREPSIYQSLDGSTCRGSLGTAPFPKGKDVLYRVVHERGEFLATAHHRVFCSDRTDRHFGSLRAGDYLYQHSSFDRRQTYCEASRLSLREDGQHCYEISADLKDRYLTCSHQYDQQPHPALDSDQEFFPSQGDALELYRRAEPMDDLWEPGQQYNRQNQSCARPSMLDLSARAAHPVLIDANRTAVVMPEYILPDNQLFWICHDWNELHQTAYEQDHSHI